MAIRHRKETSKERTVRESMNQYVFQPTGAYAAFTAWQGLGLALAFIFAIGALLTDQAYYLIGMALGIPPYLYGANGKRMLIWRMQDYQDDILNALTDKVIESTIREEEPDTTPGERRIPVRSGGRVREQISVADENPLTDKEWQSVAVALLVYRADFSKAGICKQTKEPGWQFVKISQPKYLSWRQYMDKNKYARDTVTEKGTAGNVLTPEGYELLTRYVPDGYHIRLVAPTPPPALNSN